MSSFKGPKPFSLIQSFLRTANRKSQCHRFFSSGPLNPNTNLPYSSEPSYPSLVKILHWGSGIPVVCSIAAVLAAQQAGQNKEGTDSAPKGTFLNAKQGEWMYRHKSMGLLSLIMVMPRIAVRILSSSLSSKMPSHIPGSPIILNYLADTAHLGLYSFILFMGISGISMGYFGGKGLPFFSTTFLIGEDGGKARDGSIAKSAFGWHKWVGTYGKFLIPLHVGGAGVHVLRGDRIFGRIVPGLWNFGRIVPGL